MDSIWLGAFVAVAIVLASFVVASLWRSWVASAKMRARGARARAGELAAAGLLESCGLEVIDAQATIEYPIEVDGETMMIALRADYLVRDRRTRATYVAEVKTGAFAPRLETAATRRQLLEYAIAFDVDGVLLVDAEARTVRAVAFPTERHRMRTVRRTGS